MRRRSIPLVLCVAGSFACSPGDRNKSDGTANDSGGDVFDTGPGDDGDGVSDQPVYLRVGGLLQVTAGAVEVGDSQLQQELLNEDAELLCDDVLAVNEASAEATDEESALLGWWELALDPPLSDCASLEDASPTSLFLGIGLMDPEIVAALAPKGLKEAADSLYAAYASFDKGVHIYVFGVAGLPAQYEADAEAPPVDGLADGLYDVRGIYTFKLSD